MYSHKYHFWIGSNHNSEENFLEYFELDYREDVDLDSPDYIVCGFCKDTGNIWYDEDFLLINHLAEDVKVTELLKNLISPLDLDAAVEACHSHGIYKANSIIIYTTEDFIVKKPHENTYNGLKYIGEFFYI